MPIIIPREGAFFILPDAVTQEQRDKLWEQIVRNWAQNNTDKILAIMSEDQPCDYIDVE